jgi:hypothetical protein
VVHPDDHVEIVQLLAHYTHVVDAAAWDRLGEIFTEDGTMTVTGIHDTHRGLAELRELYGVKMRHPLAHHSTSVVVLAGDRAAASVVSKWITIRAGGQAGTGVYRDDLVRTPAGWRVAARVATPGGA